MTGKPGTRSNRLADATSPYLLQHAHNPVDWYEWGPAALQRAREEDKPIFLSIGYSACHWCHVMAHESFESEEIAAVMNEHFVNIKVDREERPDIDEIYMQATMIVNNGQGGWPMSVWLTPDLKPFFAGTYFPPESRFGRPGFKDLCERIGELWSTKREALVADADRLSDYVRRSLETGEREGTFSLAAIDKTIQTLADAFDADRGGIVSGGSNKFPPSMSLGLFLRAIGRDGPESDRAQRLRKLVDVTLRNMARGGIYDHLAGGIARYSTDREWHVPHFEKMLYDQALVSRIYVDAWQFSAAPLYRQTAEDIFDYVLADLRSPQGGFYSARDADSEGEEGKYYVWTRQEVLAALGDEAGPLFCDYYDVRADGNWNDPHAPGVPKNVLRITHDLESVAGNHGLEPDAARKMLRHARRKLLDVRQQRMPPARDDKIIAEWNGLMIASLARGGAVFGEPKYIEAAADAAQFVLAQQRKDGRLLRAWRDGRMTDSAFLTDYAALIAGLIELYEATFEKKWLDEAVALNRTLTEHYYDEEEGGYFFTSDDHEPLLARSKDIRDGATPSGNSIQLMNLLRLSVILGDEQLRGMAEETMSAFAADVMQMPGAGERFLAAVEFALVSPVEVAIVGDPAGAQTQALLQEIQSTYLPNRVVMLARPDAPARNVESPLLANRTLVDGRPAAYVCRNYTCQQPATTREALREQLSE